jgi:translation elongation factor EF-4
MDFMDQERERGITINAASISFNWLGHQVQSKLIRHCRWRTLRAMVRLSYCAQTSCDANLIVNTIPIIASLCP